MYCPGGQKVKGRRVIEYILCVYSQRQASMAMNVDMTAQIF